MTQVRSHTRSSHNVITRELSHHRAELEEHTEGLSNATGSAEDSHLRAACSRCEGSSRCTGHLRAKRKHRVGGRGGDRKTRGIHKCQRQDVCESNGSLSLGWRRSSWRWRADPRQVTRTVGQTRTPQRLHTRVAGSSRKRYCPANIGEVVLSILWPDISIGARGRYCLAVECHE